MDHSKVPRFWKYLKTHNGMGIRQLASESLNAETGRCHWSEFQNYFPFILNYQMSLICRYVRLWYDVINIQAMIYVYKWKSDKFVYKVFKKSDLNIS